MILVEEVVYNQNNNDAQLASLSVLSYELLGTVVIGCTNSEYWCELGIVLSVIGRCTHFDILNRICHLSDHFSS